MIMICKSVAAINKHFNQRIANIERMYEHDGEKREHLIEVYDAERVKILQAFDRHATVGCNSVVIRQQGMQMVLAEYI